MAYLMVAFDLVPGLGAPLLGGDSNLLGDDTLDEAATCCIIVDLF